MAALLVLCSALVYGVGDFNGGLAARRTAATAVLLWSHGVGLVLVATTLPFVDASPTGRDLVLGAVAGLAGAAGVGLFYQALAMGRMTVIAPITALLAAAVPVAVGVGQGDDVHLGAALGMALALAAIVLVSAEGEGRLRPSAADRDAVLLGLGAGLGFGLFFVVLSHTGDDAGTWPIFVARSASVVVVGVLALTGRAVATMPSGARARTAVAGTCDVTANLLYLFAVRDGLLSVVAVLAALYPVSTVVLARLLLHERFVRLQRIGMALALPAIVLLARA